MILEMLKGLSPDEIRNALESTADQIQEDFSYTRPLPQEEIETRRIELEQEMLKLSDLQREASDAAKDYRERIKSIKGFVAENLSALRNKSVHVTGKVYMLADHEENVMLYVDADGNVITKRPLTAAERQGNVFSLRKNAI